MAIETATNINQNLGSHLFQQGRKFFEFETNDKIWPLDDVIDATLDLLKDQPCMRITVLNFYNKLFNEYCHQYCLMNTSSQPQYSNNNDNNQANFPVLMKFVFALNNANKQQPPSTPSSNQSCRLQKKKRSTDSNDVLEPNQMQDCPQSPPRDYEMEDVSSLAANNNNNHMQNDLALVLNLLDKHLIRLRNLLSYLLKNENNSSEQTSISNISISDWALDLATQISRKYHMFIDCEFNLVKSLAFWKQCSAMQVLFGIILDSIHKIDPGTLINRILIYPPHSDWILAKLFTNMTESEYLRNYIEKLIMLPSESSISILSLVSQHNPDAIVNCSKSNIPFLLKLCTNSKPLLELLAYDIVKQVHIETLNQLAQSQSSLPATKMDELDMDILSCMLNAPNSFELFKISFDLVQHPDSSETLVDRTMKLLKLLVKHLHQFTYETRIDCKNDVLWHSLLDMLRNHSHTLIYYPSINQIASLKQIQVQLLSMSCMHHGMQYSTDVFHQVLNLQTCTINHTNYENPTRNNLLFCLYTSLRLHQDFSVKDCIKETLDSHRTKNLYYWSNLMTFIINYWIDLDIFQLIFYLNQKPTNKQDVYRMFYILEILNIVLSDRGTRMNQDYGMSTNRRQQYALCISLVKTWFWLLNSIKIYHNHHLTVIIHCLIKCGHFLRMLSLSNNSLNQLIISRTLLEFGHGMNDLFSQQQFMQSTTNLNLFNYNHKYKVSLLEKNMSIDHKYQKNPLNPSYGMMKRLCVKNPTSLLNRQFFIDLLQECIQNRTFFAECFVDLVSKDQYLARDVPWLEEDCKDGKIQHQRMTIEMDLRVYRSFNENPVFWDILKYLSKHQCLTPCLVLLKCIVNILRTNLLSSTPNSQLTFQTKKFVALMANNEILPTIPFLYISEILSEQLKPPEMAFLLHDIVKYLRDKRPNEILPLKQYMNRFRVILAHQEPGDFYWKIFSRM